MTKKETVQTVEQDIEIKDVQEIIPKELPLVVKLPEDASLAQVAFAKTINAYAYQNPEKFTQKKDAFMKKLKELKNAPDPKTEGNLKINNSLV